MKTQDNNLDFKRNTLVELNDNDLQTINGGWTPFFPLVSLVSMSILLKK